MCGFLFACGCATVVSGTVRTIHLRTDPPGATVRMNGQIRGVTPLDLDIPASSGSRTVDLEKEGHYPRRVLLETSLNGWVFGNVLLGILPVLVDLATGAAFNLEPETVFETLPPRR
jgi:hypothetical protein